uniref:Uncharacterized protein n=2 Tax=Opuntia streptacantha TaxID=393608 RepID=A0A7C9B0V5_OPUST
MCSTLLLIINKRIPCLVLPLFSLLPNGADYFSLSLNSPPFFPTLKLPQNFPNPNHFFIKIQTCSRFRGYPFEISLQNQMEEEIGGGNGSEKKREEVDGGEMQGGGDRKRRRVAVDRSGEGGGEV